MMKKIVYTLLCVGTTLFADADPESFRKELGIEKEVVSSQKASHLYLVHHGSTDWSVQKKLQGWNQVSLNEQGRQETEKLLASLPSIQFSAIYTSSLQSCIETSELLQKKLNIPVYPLDALRGEFHGSFDGLDRKEYEMHPHFQWYRKLPASEEIFAPCGLGGESKADMAKRNIPALQKIAAQHPGENVIVVVHGGLFKFLQYYMGKKTADDRTLSLPYGGAMVIDADENHLYLP